MSLIGMSFCSMSLVGMSFNSMCLVSVYFCSMCLVSMSVAGRSRTFMALSDGSMVSGVRMRRVVCVKANEQEHQTHQRQ